MSVDLQRWLHQHRNTLLVRWSHALSAPALVGIPVPSAVNGSGDVDNDTASLLENLFDAIVQAARGDQHLLDAALLTHGFESERDDAGSHLPDMLALGFGLARAVREYLAEISDRHEAFALSCALDTIIEQSTMRLAQTWAERSSELIRDREFMASSLDNAVATADKSALQLKALNDISQQLSAILDRDAILDLVVSSLLHLTGFSQLTVWEPVSVASGQHLIVRHSSDMCLPTPVTLDQHTDLIVRAYSTAQMQIEELPNAMAQGNWYLSEHNVLAFPMLASDGTIGVVVVQQRGLLMELREQLALIQGVVSQAAIALQNADLYAQVRSLNHVLEQRVEQRTAELQEEKDRLATLHQLATEVSGTIELDQVMETSLNTLAAITQAEHASIMMVEEDASTLLVTRAVLGMPGPGNHTRFAFGSGIAGWVAQHRRPALVPDLSLDERWVTVLGGSLRKREGSMVTVPLIAHGDVIGVLTLSHQQVGYFNENHLRLLNASSGAIAIGISNARLFQMLTDEGIRRSELIATQSQIVSQTTAILQSLADGVIVCDLYGSVLSVNAAAASILQRNVEELVVWNLHDLLKRYLGQRSEEMPLDSLLARPHDNAGNARLIETTARVGSRVVSMTMVPVLKESSEMLGALLVLRDITREVEADRLKIEFIGTMSHELRTPMTAIKGFTQLLLMGSVGPLNDTQGEFVGTIYSNTERMIAIINDVLDITKIESGSIDLEWRSLHLAEVLSGVVADVQSMVTAREHQLSLSMASGLPLVRADAYRLHQILYNVLSNAVKYTPRNGQIWVEAQEYQPDNVPEHIRLTLASGRRYVHLAVRDTGVGVSADEIDRIFDRFYRTENPLKVEAGGTGLGLSLVKPLVELLGGRIWAVSELGVGSTFNVLLAT
jgi:PAS domain S-box-containing protein